MLSIVSDSDRIDFYTRDDALRNGSLVDVSTVAREQGFTIPVVLTPAVLRLLEPSPEEMCYGEDLWSRLRRLFAMMHLTLRRKAHIEASRIDFPINCSSDENPSPVLRALFHRDALGEPVITIMLPDEDQTIVDNMVSRYGEVQP